MVPFRSMLVLSLFISLGINAIGQENNATSYQLHGFVRSDFYEDSRKMSTSSLDFFSYYPMPRRLNAYGDDLNDVPSAGLSSVFTRFQLSMDGPGIFGASSSQSYVEADFGGSPSYWLVRIRQAYTRLNWKKGYLLVGQYWHPLFTPDLKPDVLSLNTGSPFQPFNRSPQLLLNYGDRLKWTAAAVYQMMYTSTGPDGKTYLYQHNAVVPDLFASVDYSEHRFLTGLAVDYKSILPEQYITDGNGVKTVNKRKLNTPAFMVYGKYTGKSLIVSAKALYVQNLTDHILIGGYAITTDHNYIPYNTFTS
ncbi:MAG: hypothetical protein Q8914_09730, partial [Bacteroidota bacterium]|nr:hypothetical protein [Bacteroidota bacterium]